MLNNAERYVIVGAIIGRMEHDNIITFTLDFTYEDMVELADKLIQEFDAEIKYDYFSEFVQDRLLKLQKEQK